MSQMTPSSMDRINACPASPSLPQVHEENVYAATGTLIHDYLENVSRHGREEALARVDEDHRILCAAIDTDRLPIGPGFHPEVAMAYRWTDGTARIIGQVEGRDYGAIADDEIAGKPDVISVEGDHVYVGDYKSGHMPPPPDSWQLRTYALTAARAYGCSRATCEILRIGPNGEVWRVSVDMDALELHLHEAAIRDLVARVAKARAIIAAGETPAVTVGEHCRYCPAYRSCPATLALARELAQPATLADEIRAALTPETAAAAYERIKLAEKVIATVKAELKGWAQQQPIPTATGKTYGPRPWSVRTIDPDKAHPVLVELLGLEAADQVCRRVATLSALDRTVKEIAVGKGEKVAPMQRSIIAELERQGAISTEHTEQVREYDDPHATKPVAAKPKLAPVVLAPRIETKPAVKFDPSAVLF